MRGKILNLIAVLNGSGREYDIGELVTYLNDACMVAPSMLLTPAATWTAVDDRAFDVTLVDRGNTATARIFVDDIGQLLDFSTTEPILHLPEWAGAGTLDYTSGRLEVREGSMAADERKYHLAPARR
jgi:hypothetical protein